jgi:hypothetical protein
MRSIELAAFSRRDKALPLPHIFFTDVEAFSGCYYHPINEPLYIVEVDKVIAAGESAIVVSTLFGSDVGNTVAHEWRHHWQFYNGRQPETVRQFEESKSYRRAIVIYYQQHHELDALMYSLHLEPDDTQKEHLEWVRTAIVRG